jgi:diguanylate cyclase (GGDEF)-like protein/PAS domain S-box-containing protein
MSLSLEASKAQALRFKRTLLAVAVSFGAIALMVCMTLTQLLPVGALVSASILVAICCVVFLVLVKTGTNYRMQDPSMTTPQVLASALVLLVVAFQATPHGHTIALLTIPVAFGFASFRFGLVDLLRLFWFVCAMATVEVAARVGLAPPGQMQSTWIEIAAGYAGMIVVLASLAVTGGTLNDMRRRNWAERMSAHVAMGKLEEAVLTLSVDKRIRFFNAGSARLFGVPAEEMASTDIDEICQFIERAPVSEFLAQLAANAKSSGAIGSKEHSATAMSETIDGIIVTRAGKERNIELSASIVSSMRGQEDGFVLVARDTTEREQMIGDLRHAATHDVLTGLLNRRGFSEAIGTVIADRCSAADNVRPWAIAIDLNRFKVVNDAVGHQAGDELLRQVASMMRTVVPKGAVLARLGGDEFGVLLVSSDPDVAVKLGETMIREFADMRFKWDDRIFKVGASIGVAEYTSDCINVEELLSRADSASYLAKERGTNRVQKFSQRRADVSRHQADVNWVSTINHALENDRFVLFGQRIAKADPNQTIADGKFELLIRMLGEDDQIILPALFLPAAERFGLIAALDRHVISLATRELGQYKATGAAVPQISINLSPNSLRDPNLLKYIEQGLADADLPGELFTFELTETAAIFDLDQAVKFFGDLRKMGCQIALDDVGSGFNSFYNMRQLPLDQIKIDGSYVRAACENPLDRVFVESVQNIAATLGVRTVAEFVEDDKIRQTMFDIGVDYVQGFGLHRPERLTDILEKCQQAEKSEMANRAARANKAAKNEALTPTQ